MAGPSRQVTYRLRARPAADKKYRIVIQKRAWLFFWKDWYPVENAVRSLQHEFIEHYERMQEILRELVDAEAWEQGTYKFLDLGNKGEGVSTPFKEDLRPSETLMPDVSERFKKLKGIVEQSQGPHGPGRGTRTAYVVPTTKRFDLSTLNREKLGEDFSVDQVIDYRPPTQDNKHRHNKGNQNNQNQGKQNQENS